MSSNNASILPVICLMGPTAAGKTDIAIDLVEQLPCDIISVDSAMVYRGMDIGTAKPTVAERERAPHRLIDIRDPLDSYSAASFCTDARREIDEILAAGRIPLLVGGTMLYFYALQRGLSQLPEADPEVRQQLEREAEAIGWAAMHQRLRAIDPAAAQRIHSNDPQRIQRALEVYIISGKSLTALHDEFKPQGAPYQFLSFALAPDDRSVLHQRIEQRFDQMLAAGFLDEVQALYDRGDLHEDLPSIRAVGYQQAWDYISGKYVYDKMRELAIIASRQLAKRQLTWLRGWPVTKWLAFDHAQALSQMLKELENFK